MEIHIAIFSLSVCLRRLFPKIHEKHEFRDPMEGSVFMVIQCNVVLWIHIAMESIMLSNALFSNIENTGKQIEIGVLTLYPRMEESFKRRKCVSNEF